MSQYRKVIGVTEINIAKAMDQLGGSSRLYKKLVSGFLEKYSRVDKDLKYLLLDGELEDARRLAHTMKGLGGNLGAGEFHEIAKSLEYAIRDLDGQEAGKKDTTAILTNEWRGFSENLSEVLEELDKILYADDQDLESAESSKDLDSERDIFIPVNNESSYVSGHGKETVRYMINMLQTYNYESVKNAMEQLDFSAIEKVCPKCRDKFLSAVREYEFDEAVSIMERVIDD